MSARIGTAALYNLQNYHMFQTQAQVNDLMLQTSTQDKTQVFSGIAYESNSFVNLQIDVTKRTTYQASINGIETRMKVADLSMDKIEELAIDFQTLLTQAQNKTDSPKVNEQARTYIQQIADFLNVRDGTRWVFSGTNATNGDVPVDVSTLTLDTTIAPGTGFRNLSAAQVGVAGSFTVATGADTGAAVSQAAADTHNAAAPVAPPAAAATGAGFSDYYYQTNTVAYPDRVFNETRQTFQAADNVRLSVGVNADDSAFQRIIRTMSYFARIDENVPDVNNKIDSSNIQAAVAELTTALTELRSVRGKVTSQLQQLDKLKDDHASFINLAKNSLGSVITADPATTAVLLSNYRSQLENSYAAISTVRQISLVNFLR